MLISIQYGRAMAAALVVWAHLAGFALVIPLGLREFGGFGVDIFFVISGFIMWETAVGQSPRDFAVRRLSRVVPAYWFYTALIIAVSIFAPALTPRVHPDFLEAICSFLFIPHANARGEINPVLLQGWTLNYEMYFYLVFGVTLLLRSPKVRFLSIATLFVASSIAGALTTPTSDIARVYTSSILLEFVLGMALSVVAQRWKQGSRGFYAGLCVVGAVMLGVADHFSPTAEQRFLAFGLPACVLLYGAMGLEPSLRRHPCKPAIALGNASYSLYLAHPFVLSAAAIGVKLTAAKLSMNPVASALAFIFVSASACFAVAILSHRWLEVPMGRFASASLRSGRRS